MRPLRLALPLTAFAAACILVRCSTDTFVSADAGDGGAADAEADASRVEDAPSSFEGGPVEAAVDASCPEVPANAACPSGCGFAQACCVSPQSASCEALTGVTCSGDVLSCTAQADCKGKTCCLSAGDAGVCPLTLGAPVATSCKDSCAGAEARVCDVADPNACSIGTCREAKLAGTGWTIGVCVP